MSTALKQELEKQMKLSSGLIFVTALAFSPLSTSALPLPYESSHTGFAYDDQLYSYPALEVSAEGTVHLRVLFSNSRNWRGTYTLGITVEFMKDGEPIYAVSQSHDTYVRHGTKEEWRVWELDVPREVLDLSDDVRFSHFSGRPHLPNGPLYSCAEFYSNGGFCF